MSEAACGVCKCCYAKDAEIARIKDQIERLEKMLGKVNSELEAKDKLVIGFISQWRRAREATF